MGGEGKETTREGPVLDERTARPRSGRVGVSPQTHNSSGSIELRGDRSWSPGKALPAQESLMS